MKKHKIKNIEIPNKKVIEEILAERKETHGDFREQATLSEELKFHMRNSPNWPYLSSMKTEALDMIVHKISRVLTGNSHHKDHWDDIAGYALLVSKELE